MTAPRAAVGMAASNFGFRGLRSASRFEVGAERLLQPPIDARIFAARPRSTSQTSPLEARVAAVEAKLDAGDWGDDLSDDLRAAINAIGEFKLKR